MIKLKHLTMSLLGGFTGCDPGEQFVKRDGAHVWMNLAREM